jgi:hypothetical protein
MGRTWVGHKDPLPWDTVSQCWGVRAEGSTPLDTYNTLWHTGVAFGETSARGEDTGMHDEQRALRWKNGNGTWNPWPNDDCSEDTSSSWDWDRVSSNEYNVVQTGRTVRGR